MDPRFPLRAACSCWDILLSTHNFRDPIHPRNGGTGTCGYIVGRLVEKPFCQPTYLRGWSILDLEQGRWHTCTHRERQLVAESNHVVHGVVAADGGLVCEYVSRSRLRRVDSVITIYNPLATTGSTTLPTIPHHLLAGYGRFRILNFIVNELDNSFKVFVINEGIRPRIFGDPGDHTVVMAIYDSTTGRWRGAANPRHWNFVERGVGYGGSSVMYRGLLYMVFDPYRPRLGIPTRLGWLFTYNIVDDVWNDTGVHIDNLYVNHARAQLVVSDDRLFLASNNPVDREASSSSSSKFCLYEVLLGERVLLMEVFQTTIPDVFRHLSVGLRTFWVHQSDGPSLLVFGYKKSIYVVFERIGTPIVYNLQFSSWSLLSPNPMHPLDPGCELVWYAKTMSLHQPTEDEVAEITLLERL